MQVRVEYDPGAVREAFGGPGGFALAGAIERTVRTDLEAFRELVEARVAAAATPAEPVVEAPGTVTVNGI